MNKLSRVASIAGSNEKQEKERRKLHEKILHELRLLANNISGANAQTPHEAVSSIPSLRKWDVATRHIAQSFWTDSLQFV